MPASFTCQTPGAACDIVVEEEEEEAVGEGLVSPSAEAVGEVVGDSAVEDGGVGALGAEIDAVGAEIDAAVGGVELWITL